MLRTLAALAAALFALPTALAPGRAAAYPLDGYEYTGIHRLEVQRLVQTGQATGGRKRPSGELLPMEKVQLRLLQHRDLELPPPDPQLTAEVKRLLGAQASRYGIGLLDLSDLANIRYAEWNGKQHQNPGSVGKILVALAIYQALADIYPDDIAARERVLRDTMITADIFSVYDHHTVQKHDPETGRLWRAPIQQGDRATLWTYIDWMMSPSSNSAAGMLQKHLILLKQYGEQYPPSEEESDRFFEETPKTELAAIFEEAIQGPVTRNGLDLDMMRQGSFFTRQGKIRVPGASSYATPRELMLYLLRMEQGRLVDEWSSREIKRLLYITERRIRYGSSGVLRPSAVYFKSGSLYSCQPEEGFTCKKYHGNKRNYMNSAAIIESPAGQNHLYYMTTVLSNVLRKNSAQDHRDLARAIHARLQRDHPLPRLAEGELPLSASYGEGFIGYAEERRAVALKFEIQEALLDLGYEIGDIDGQIGSKTRSAIRDFEKQQGIAATGQASEKLLTRMRGKARD
ncbi:MAG: peptidoglycan-binding protein [Deltaproteobacteria bacterium]|nr:peptidoglycan-binding protein [Deltaproteobacteria bacterium]